jgi:hypothetical protein
MFMGSDCIGGICDMCKRVGRKSLGVTNLFVDISSDTTCVINIRMNPSIVYESNYVYIGRGSIYGNPFTHLPLEQTGGIVKAESRDDSIQRYNDWIDGKIDIPNIRPPTDREIGMLFGKMLGCFCKPKACHGDVLAVRAKSYSDRKLKK